MYVKRACCMQQAENATATHDIVLLVPLPDGIPLGKLVRVYH